MSSCTSEMTRRIADLVRGRTAWPLASLHPVRQTSEQRKSVPRSTDSKSLLTVAEYSLPSCMSPQARVVTKRRKDEKKGRVEKFLNQVVLASRNISAFLLRQSTHVDRSYHCCKFELKRTSRTISGFIPSRPQLSQFNVFKFQTCTASTRALNMRNAAISFVLSP